MDNEGIHASQEEGPDERLQQPMAIAPNVLDGGVRDKGISLAQGDEAGIDGRLEQLEAVAPSEVIAAPVHGLSEPGNLGLEVSPLEATIAVAIAPSPSVSATKTTSVMYSK
ncbi:hypothetical protein AMTR_s00107p00120570 [Amborella trichopoda]|uniref:Uncharacterized protein n=1 Tax=Amborella trichopoda TaxID=13333 RepID=W1P038_AMBTC|nr:hypothetical protein AMTR_s00107p00120570 [Amborella trichopoda]